jgi:cytochrome c-type biogenesis protein CcmH/NrfG
MNNYRIIFAFMAVLCVLAAFVYWTLYRTHTVAEQIDMASTTPIVAAATTSDPGYTVTVQHMPQYPAINRPLPAAPAGMSTDAHASLTTRLGDTAKKLAADPKDLGAWILLGTYRSALGDYEGARQAWEFVTKASPRDPQAYGNLGDLYQNHLHDLAKSEANYAVAVKYAPNNPGYCRLLAEVQAQEGKTTAAAATLSACITRIPAATDLPVVLAHLYRDAGMTAEAKTAYAAAISAAEANGNPSLAADLRAELSALQ